jgi:hypothetical protein
MAEQTALFVYTTERRTNCVRSVDLTIAAVHRLAFLETDSSSTLRQILKSISSVRDSKWMVSGLQNWIEVGAVDC